MVYSYTSNAQLLISKEAIQNNIATYRSLLNADTKLLLMVKANGYGTDSVMVASAVDHQVDYLGAAYSSNAYQLRESGVKTPIMVMAPEPADLTKLVLYNALEPVLYSLEIIKAAAELNQPIRAHIEIDSGMRRLGLKKEELEEAQSLILGSNIEVVSIFSHLAGPAEEEHDVFTEEQAAYFEKCFEVLANRLPNRPLKHLASSAGLARFPQYQFDMVRIGIGFYGYDPAHLIQNKLQTIATLQTKVLQVMELKAGETIGYSRMGSLPYNAKVATLAIGYGDGYLRVFGNGNAQVFVNGNTANTVGNICMDLTMIDVTHIDCQPGDVVELFGSHITIDTLAEEAKTIPYEILTNISPRVERILVD